MEKLQPLANQWRHKKKRRPTKKQIIAIISMTIAKRRVTALPQSQSLRSLGKTPNRKVGLKEWEVCRNK
jgi:hypothetical protein